MVSPPLTSHYAQLLITDRHKVHLGRGQGIWSPGKDTAGSSGNRAILCRPLSVKVPPSLGTLFHPSKSPLPALTLLSVKVPSFFIDLVVSRQSLPSLSTLSSVKGPSFSYRPCRRSKPPSFKQLIPLHWENSWRSPESSKCSRTSWSAMRGNRSNGSLGPWTGE